MLHPPPEPEHDKTLSRPYSPSLIPNPKRLNPKFATRCHERRYDEDHSGMAPHGSSRLDVGLGFRV